MISLIEHIEFLTLRHDCVVVPGWGAFIAQYESARYDALTGVTHSPRRVISFNARVEHSDGLLAQSLMRRESLTYDAACHAIEKCVAKFKQQFNADGQLSFGRVGYFTRGLNGAPLFMPILDGGNDACDIYYGLTDLTIHPLDFVVDRVSERDELRRRMVMPRWVKRAGQVAAAIVLLLGMTVVLTTPASLGEREREYAAVSLPGMNTASRPVFNWDKADMNLSIAMPVDHREAARPVTQQGRYHLVVSSLSSREQFEDFLASHPDIAQRARLIERDGKFRVIVASNDDKAELLKERAMLPAAYASSWICE